MTSFLVASQYSHTGKPAPLRVGLKHLMIALLPFQLGDEVEDEQRTRRWLIAILFIGVAARVLRYVLRFPFWEDECFLSYNLIHLDYAQLTGPLQYQQVTPPAFLWVQKALTQILGFSELSLRLFAFISSLISLALFARVAQLLLRGSAMLIAVSIFAVAYPAIRYGAEAKPYGVDLAVSMVIITLTVQWLRDRRARFLWLLAAFMPLAVTVSFPSVFIAGGASLVIFAVLMREKSAQAWAAWVAINVLMIAAFTFVLSLRSPAHQDTEALMVRDWDAQFMPITRPLELPLWFLKTFTGDALGVPVGSERGGSSLTFILCLCGIIALWRAGRRGWAGALILPVAIHLAASALRRYPIGGHVRFSMHLIPIICLLAGVGGAAILRLLWAESRRWAATRLAIIALLVIAAGSMTRDILRPYKTLSDERARGFAIWFWFDLPHEGEVACLKTDLGIDFSPQTFEQMSFAAMYLVNQHLASPRLREGRAIDFNKVSQNWPLYIVEFRDWEKPYDYAGQRRWLEGMKEKFSLDAVQSYPLTRYDKWERRLMMTDHIVVYRFVPR